MEKSRVQLDTLFAKMVPYTTEQRVFIVETFLVNVTFNESFREILYFIKYFKNALFRRARPRREDNIKTDLRKTGVEGVDSIRQGQSSVPWRGVVTAARNLRVPQKDDK